MKKKLVTIDTNVLPFNNLDKLINDKHIEVAYVSVTEREARDSLIENQLKDIGNKIFEVGVFGESEYGNAVYGGKNNKLKMILEIISSSSFPKNRNELSQNQRKQLRDAMILEAHSRRKRDVFVTNDKKVFIKHGRKEELEKLLKTLILTKEQFINYCGNLK